MTEIELPVAHLRRAPLPGICARTGEPTTRTYRRVLYKRRPWLYVLIPFSLLLAVVLLHFAGDPLTLRVPAAPALHRRRVAYGWLAGVTAPVAFFSLVGALVDPSAGTFVAAALATAACLAGLVGRARLNVRIVRDADVVRMTVHPTLAAALTQPAPGWHPDPSGARRYRWWDGTRWTDHVTA